MSDVTDNCTLLLHQPLAGVNLAIIECSSGSATDTIELDELLESNELGSRVKTVKYAHCVEDFDGTPVNRAMKWNKSNDTLTIGSGPSSAELTIKVKFV